MKSAPKPSGREAEPPSVDGEVSLDARRAQEAGGNAPLVAHVVPADRDLRYDPESGELLLPVEVILREGSTTRSVLRVGPGQVELLSIQLERAIARRQQALDARTTA